MLDAAAQRIGRGRLAVHHEDLLGRARQRAQPLHQPVGVGMAGEATAIGDAIGLALKRIRDIAAKSRVLILVTDGKSNTGSLAPKQAAEIAKEMGVKIHAVGIGGEGRAPFRVQTPFGSQVVYRDMEYDEQTLQDIASITGGQYFNARDTSGLQKVYQQIDSLEMRHERTLQHIEYDERFFPFLVLGFLAIFLARLLQSTVFLTLP